MVDNSTMNALFDVDRVHPAAVRKECDLDPGVKAVLDRRAARKASHGPYPARSDGEIRERLEALVESEFSGAILVDAGRLGGGASKEQFGFELAGETQYSGRYVLRMEPLQSISESDRGREVDLLHAVQGLVPAPLPVWLDADGRHFGQPASILHFVEGVTKPSDGVATVTGLGTFIPARLREQITPQFIRYLAAIHSLPCDHARLTSFDVPDADPQQAARWQVNWWSRIQREDEIQAIPVLTLAEEWMRSHLPKCEDVVLVHGDYRTGNYLFDETTGLISAILDWELAHFGDFHEDLAWTLQQIFGCTDAGTFLASGLLPREEMISCYEEATSRTVDPASLHFYEVLSAYKCVVMTLATGMRAVRDCGSACKKDPFSGVIGV